MQQDKEIARFCRVLSVETRASIIRILAERGPLCVGALARELDVSSGAVSQHLRVMRDNGFVDTDRCGYYIHYHLTPGLEAKMRQLVDTLLSNANRADNEGCRRKVER
ncbi:MAG: ArsR/SmtB family transcription factor [Verrucomicrobiota bacterium]